MNTDELRSTYGGGILYRDGLGESVGKLGRRPHRVLVRTRS